jgi:TonB-dependent siderophore receptor
MKPSPLWTMVRNNLLKGRGALMRIAVVATAICFSIVGFAVADNAAAAIRKTTNIPAEGLGPALTTLAKEFDFQVLYRTETVGKLRTEGASGALTATEALQHVLNGTGLTYRYLDEKTVTIVSADALSSEDQNLPPAAGDVAGANAAKEGKKDTSNGFRLAQATQGNTSNSASVSSSSPNSGENKIALEEIVVTGRYEFLSADTSGTTGLPLPIEKVPQSISLVSSDFIKAADLKTLAEIAEYTPGAINAGSQENYGTAIKLRGFTPGRAVDGINTIQSFTYYEPDYAIFDRLEIVKGPSSVVYGVSSPGGLVNFVTKSATPQTPDYLYAQAGSWNNYRVEGQIAGALDGSGRVRAIGVAVYDRGDSFIDVLNHKKTSLYGGVNVQLSDSVTAYLHGGYERLQRTVFDGIPTEADGTPAPVPRSFFIGSKNVETTTSVYHAEGDLTWHATDLLDFSIKGNYENSSFVGSEYYSSGLQPDGTLSFRVQKYPEPYFDHNFGIGLSSTYRLDAMGLKDSFVSVAALYQDSRQGGVALTLPNPGGTTNIFSGEAAIGQAIDAALLTPLNRFEQVTDAKTLTFSGQSVLQLVDSLSVLLGVSYAKPDVTAVTNGTTNDLSAAGQTSYRAGVTYEFLPGTNAYVSFSQSFNPQTLLTVTNEPLPPVTGDQYEAGIKYRVPNGRLLLTGAIFRIKEKNVAQYDQTVNGIDYYRAVGGVTHKGIELLALGQITPDWQINAGYTYLNAKITKAISTGFYPLDATVGQSELYLPKQTFSLSSTYLVPTGLLRGLSFGVGIRYVGAQSTGYDSMLANQEAFFSPTKTKDLPSYTPVDASVGYSVGKWLVQLNAHNIFDRFYLINNYQTLFYGNVVGDPANVALSVRRTF